MPSAAEVDAYGCVCQTLKTVKNFAVHEGVAARDRLIRLQFLAQCYTIADECSRLRLAPLIYVQIS